jgi:hypothetical protein
LSADLLAEIAWKAYFEAAPYIAELNWTKEVIAKAIQNALDLPQFRKRIETILRNERDHARVSDLRIYLMFLERQS